MNTVRRKTRRVRHLVIGWTVLTAASLVQLSTPNTGLPFEEPTCGGEPCNSRHPECAAAAQSNHDQRMEQCRVENHPESTCKDEVQKSFVSDIIQCRVTAEEQVRFRQAPTVNLEAYNYYWRGVKDLERSMFGANVHSFQDINAQARQLLEKATELDPQFAAAYARLGQTYLQEWFAQGGHRLAASGNCRAQSKCGIWHSPVVCCL